MKRNFRLVLAWALAVVGTAFATPQSPPAGAGPGASATGMLFVKIEPGSFQMGCSRGDGDCNDDEKPVHTVRITKPFELGKYEVTVAEWNAVMGMSRCGGFLSGNDPVCVTWNDTRKFIDRLNDKKDGYRYRLATEAEWEYAARAGTTSRYGVDNLGDIAWYNTGPNNGRAHPVGQKKANAWGLHDMLGNASEWVQDWYGDYETGAQTDPKGPPTGSQKVLRGAYVSALPRDVRVSFRWHALTGEMRSTVGFRVAREAIV